MFPADQVDQLVRSQSDPLEVEALLAGRLHPWPLLLLREEREDRLQRLLGRHRPHPPGPLPLPHHHCRFSVEGRYTL